MKTTEGDHNFSHYIRKTHLIFTNSLFTILNCAITAQNCSTLCFLHYMTFDIVMILAAWPRGTYGVPKPATGCPIATGVHWNSGYRYHDTEDSSPSNGWSTGIHFPSGSYAKSSMKQHFCMKTSSGGSRNWPRGNYCIFKKGACPSG